MCVCLCVCVCECVCERERGGEEREVGERKGRERISLNRNTKLNPYN